MMARGRSETTTKVFVGSLPPGVTTEDLKKLFEPYGAIAECDIANRCGFLHLEDAKLAMKAIDDLNGVDFMGGKISVEKGRVKPRRPGPPMRGGRGGGPGPMRGGRGDRGGPYSREDDYRGDLRGGYGGGRDPQAYRGDRYGGGMGYDRGMRGSYPPDDRRGGGSSSYEDRRGGSRGYPTDRYGGYDRRPMPAYDDRPSPGPIPGSYDDRRGGYDDRRAPPLIADRRLDSQGVPIPRGPGSSYDSRGGGDLFSRRDANGPPKMSGGGYGDRYGSAPNGYGAAPSGGYGMDNSSAGYNTAGADYTADYSDRSYGPPAASSYGPPPNASYAVPAGGAAYPGSNGGYGDSYGSDMMSGRGGGSNVPSYDAAYPPLPQQRGYTSGGGPGPRRDVAPGRRY